MNNSVRSLGLSLYSLASDEKTDRQIYDELKMTEEIFKENSDYVKILDSAALSGKVKEKLIDEAFGENAHEYITNFLKILARKRMVYSFSECVKFFQKEYLKSRNIEAVSITTAIALSDEKKWEITEKLSKIFGKKLMAGFSDDPSVIGGMIIKFENSSIDASIRSRLNEIKRIISK